MPVKQKRKIMASLRKAHPSWSDDKVESVAYATMVKQGTYTPGGRRSSKRSTSRRRRS